MRHVRITNRRRRICTHKLRRVNIDPDKVERTRNDLQIFRRKLRRIGAIRLQVIIGVLPFFDHRQVRRVHFTHRTLGGRNVRGRLEHGRGDSDVFSQTDFRSRLRRCADRLDRQPMAQHSVVPRLVQA